MAERLAFGEIGSEGRLEFLEAKDGAVMPSAVRRIDLLNPRNLGEERAVNKTRHGSENEKEGAHHLDKDLANVVVHLVSVLAPFRSIQDTCKRLCESRNLLEVGKHDVKIRRRHERLTRQWRDDWLRRGQGRATLLKLRGERRGR